MKTPKKPGSFKLADVGGAEAFEKALTDRGFVETVARKTDGVRVDFREYRDHGHLRNSQASLNRRDPDMGSMPVVSIYYGKQPKAVASPAALPAVAAIVRDLQAPDMDV